MTTTLYLLRQQPNHIPLSIFQANDVNMDIVFIEHAASITSSMKGAVVADRRMMVNDSLRILTYDDLIEKIFLSKHIIVI